MDDLKQAGREVETDAKKASRNWDGEDLGDEVANTGDEIKKNLGNAGDELHKQADNATDRDPAGTTSDR